MDTEDGYYLAFSYCLGIGPQRFSALLNVFETAEKAYTAPLPELQEVVGLDPAHKLDIFRNSFSIERTRTEIQQKNIRVLSRRSPLFPTQLRVLPDSPICIYIKGKEEDIDFSEKLFFGIVGTRRPSWYGQQISRRFSALLTQAGFCIVSGMALGVDTVAHQAALENGGKTVAVLGCGVDIIYPPQNRKLYEQIISGGGVVLSEFPPGQTVLKGLFVARNRLISGLSAGIMVVEGLKNSGALITARYAAEQGKDVFAPPVPLTSPLSEAPNILLKQGAKLVTGVEDILEEYGINARPVLKNIVDGLSAEEQKIVSHIQSEPLIVDDIALRIQEPVTSVLNTLSMLEISGVVKKNMEGKYELAV